MKVYETRGDLSDTANSQKKPVTSFILWAKDTAEVEKIVNTDKGSKHWYGSGMYYELAKMCLAPQKEKNEMASKGFKAYYVTIIIIGRKPGW